MLKLMKELSEKDLNKTLEFINRESCNECWNCSERKKWKDLRDLFGEEIMEETVKKL